MHCPICGTSNSDDNALCIGCGAPLRGEIQRVETVSEPKADAQDAWQGGQSPSMAYTSVGESFMTPATLASEQGSTKKGIKKTLKTIGVGLITAYIVLTLAGGLGAFYIWKKGWIEFHWPWEQNQAVAAAQSGESAAQSEAEAAAVPAEQPAESQSAAPSDEGQEGGGSAAVSTMDISSDDLSFLEGTWTGTYIDTVSGPGSYRCRGGNREPLELTITNVEGRYITADIKVDYHNHGKLDHEVDGIGIDITKNYADVKMFIDENGKFNFASNPYEIGITFEYNDGKINADVVSEYNTMIEWTDEYTLEK